MSNVELVHQSHCRIGEAVIWSVAEQAIYWSDILGHKVYQHKPLLNEKGTTDSGVFQDS